MFDLQQEEQLQQVGDSIFYWLHLRLYSFLQLLAMNTLTALNKKRTQRILNDVLVNAVASMFHLDKAALLDL